MIGQSPPPEPEHAPSQASSSSTASSSAKSAEPHQEQQKQQHKKEKSNGSSKFDNIKRQLLCGLTSASSDRQNQDAAADQDSPSTGRTNTTTSSTSTSKTTILSKLSLKSSTAGSAGGGGDSSHSSASNSSKLTGSNQQLYCPSVTNSSITNSGEESSSLQQETSKSSCDHLIRMISDKNQAIEQGNKLGRLVGGSNELFILLGSQRQQQQSACGPVFRKFSIGSGEPLGQLNIPFVGKKFSILSNSTSEKSPVKIQAQQIVQIPKSSKNSKSQQCELLLIAKLNEFQDNRKKSSYLWEDPSFELEESWTEFVDLPGGSSVNPSPALNIEAADKCLSSSEQEISSLSPSKATNNLKNQQDTIWELCTTEVNYLRRLKVIIELFMSTLIELQQSHLLVELDISRMSSNIREIYEANLILWQDHIEPMIARARLDRAPLNPSSLITAFLRIKNLFYPYYRYCLEYTNCLSYVRQQSQTNELFRMYLVWCESQPECERLRLTDLLAKPMQRLTRYSLLLKAVAKRTEIEEHLRAIELMIIYMDRFVLTVDMELRRKEELERLMLIDESIEGFEITHLTGDQSSSFAQSTANNNNDNKLAYPDELLDIVRQHHAHFDLMEPLFNCPYQCHRELLFDSRESCFIHPSHKPAKMEGFAGSSSPAAGHLSANIAQASNCSSLSITSGSLSERALLSVSGQTTSSYERSGSQAGLRQTSKQCTQSKPSQSDHTNCFGGFKFKDLQMSQSTKPIEIVLLLFTDQLLICKQTNTKKVGKQAKCSTSNVIMQNCSASAAARPPTKVNQINQLSPSLNSAARGKQQHQHLDSPSLANNKGSSLDLLQQLSCEAAELPSCSMELLSSSSCSNSPRHSLDCHRSNRSSSGLGGAGARCPSSERQGASPTHLARVPSNGGASNELPPLHANNNTFRSCHSSTSSIQGSCWLSPSSSEGQQQRRDSKESQLAQKTLFGASERAARVAVERADNLENYSNYLNHVRSSSRFSTSTTTTNHAHHSNKEPRPMMTPKGGHNLRSLSFSNVMLNSAAQLLFNHSGNHNHNHNANNHHSPIRSSIRTWSQSSPCSPGLRVIRAPYPIERLVMYELRDGQSVFLCQLNDSQTVATSFVLQASLPALQSLSTSGETNNIQHHHPTELLSHLRNSSSSYEQQAISNDHQHHQWEAPGTIRQLFNNLAGGEKKSAKASTNSIARQNNEPTPARQLICLIKQAQARFHMAASFHNLRPVNFGQGLEYNLFRDELACADSSRSNSVSQEKLKSNQTGKEKQQQHRQSVRQLSAWSASFRHARPKSAKSQNNNNNNNNKSQFNFIHNRHPKNPSSETNHLGPPTNDAHDNLNSAAGSGNLRASSPSRQSLSSALNHSKEAIAMDQQHRPSASSASSEPMLKAVASQHQSMLLEHGLHEQLCSYNYHYKLGQRSDYFEVLVEPRSLMNEAAASIGGLGRVRRQQATPAGVGSSSSSLSQNSATTNNMQNYPTTSLRARAESSSNERQFRNHVFLNANYNYPNNSTSNNNNATGSQTGSQNSVFEPAASSSRGESLEIDNSTASNLSPSGATNQQRRQKQLLLSPHEYQQHQLSRQPASSASISSSLEGARSTRSGAGSRMSRHRYFSRSARLSNNADNTPFENNEHVCLSVANHRNNNKQINSNSISQQTSVTSSGSSTRSSSPPSLTRQTAAAQSTIVKRPSNTENPSLSRKVLLSSSLNQNSAGSLSRVDRVGASLASCSSATAGSDTCRFDSSAVAAAGSIGSRSSSGRRNLSLLRRQNVVLSASSDHQYQRYVPNQQQQQSQIGGSSLVEYNLLSLDTEPPSSSMGSSNDQARRSSIRQHRFLSHQHQKQNSSEANTLEQLSITLDEFDPIDGQRSIPIDEQRQQQKQFELSNSHNSSSSSLRARASFELGTLQNSRVNPLNSIEGQSDDRHHLNISQQARSASIEARSPIAVTLTRPLNEQTVQLSPTQFCIVNSDSSPTSGSWHTEFEPRRVSYLNIPQNSGNNAKSPVNLSARQSRASSCSSSDGNYLFASSADLIRSGESLSPIESSIQYSSFNTVIKSSRQHLSDTRFSCTSLNSSLSPEQRDSLDNSIAGRDDSLDGFNRDSNTDLQMLSDSQADCDQMTDFLLIEATRDDNTVRSSPGNRQQRCIGANGSRSFEFVNSQSTKRNDFSSNREGQRLRVALSDAATMDSMELDDLGEQSSKNLIDVKCIDSLVRRPDCVGGDAGGDFGDDSSEQIASKGYLGFHEKLRLYNQRVEEELERRSNRSGKDRRPDEAMSVDLLPADNDELGTSTRSSSKQNLRAAFSQLTHKSAKNIKRALLRSPNRKQRAAGSTASDTKSEEKSSSTTATESSQRKPRSAQKSVSLTRFDSFLHKASSLRSIATSVSHQSNSNK